VWYQHGNLHRDDGPAVEAPDGIREFWVDGKFIGSEQGEGYRIAVEESRARQATARRVKGSSDR
jgi:hypothetical protein